MKILSREFLSKIIELGHAYCIGVSYTNYEYKLKEKVHPYTPISKDLKNKVKKLWGGR